MERSDVTSAEPAPHQPPADEPAQAATPAHDAEPGSVLGPDLTALETLSQRPLGEHVDVYEALHESLQQQLAGIEHS